MPLVFFWNIEGLFLLVSRMGDFAKAQRKSKISRKERSDGIAKNERHLMGSHQMVWGDSKKHRTIPVLFAGDPYGTRTHVTTVKGWCLNRLTNGPSI